MKIFQSLARIKEVIHYILEHENEDFYDNPSRNHIYFSAVALQEGEEAAERMLLLVLEEKNK